jgi:hypothetical protein
MQETIARRSLTALQTAVLETVAYSDIFEFPLTEDEVWRNLPLAASREEVEVSVSALIEEHVLVAPGEYVALFGREDIRFERERRRESSRSLRRTAEHYGRLVSLLPFVRIVALTGSLAVDNARAGDDLDFLIVTAKGRVWLTRAMTMLVVRYAGLRGVTVCPNYLLSESALELSERDLYTARELRQMLPLFGHDVYDHMLAANAWWHDVLPNAEPPAEARRSSTHSFARKVCEWLLRLRPFDRLEAWLLSHKGGELARNAGPEAVFDETMCKGHFEGWRERTHRLVEERVQKILEPLS